MVPADQVEAYWKSVSGQEVELCEIKGQNINHIQGYVKKPHKYKEVLASFLTNWSNN